MSTPIECPELHAWRRARAAAEKADLDGRFSEKRRAELRSAARWASLAYDTKCEQLIAKGTRA